jgi:hypothetical protein
MDLELGGKTAIVTGASRDIRDATGRNVVAVLKTRDRGSA